MPEMPRPLQHHDAEKKDDNTLRQEAHARLSSAPVLQFMAELLQTLRQNTPPWWTAEQLREGFSATERMRWYKDRPDLRQHITTELTGLAPKTARKKSPDFQAGLIDSVIDDGDISAPKFEEAFDPRDMVVYGPVVEFWRRFRERMPWNDDSPVHQKLAAGLLRALLADKSSFEGLSRKPILSALEVRTGISSKVWHTRMPLDIRAAIDDARFQQEKGKPGAPFHAHHDLQIAVPDVITAHIPLRELAGVFDAAERAIGWESPAHHVEGKSEVAKPTDTKPSETTLSTGGATSGAAGVAAASALSPAGGGKGGAAQAVANLASALGLGSDPAEDTDEGFVVDMDEPVDERESKSHIAVGDSANGKKKKS